MQVSVNPNGVNASTVRSNPIVKLIFHCATRYQSTLTMFLFRGKTTLNDHYENLKSFFVTFLGVPELDFNMVLDN